MLERRAASLPLGYAWPRIFFVYGPNEHPQRLVSYVIRSLLAQMPARCSHGRQIRDYLHAQDVADALVAILDSDVQGPINIASGTPVTLREIVQTIAQTLDCESLVELGAVPSRPNDAPMLIGNVDRLHSALAWRPRYDLEAGLAHTIEWWRSQIAVAPVETV
jgi:nucleoside-diphosphate-sugar epimerase